MTRTPQVSVLITAFNRAGSIGASIESVLASRFSDFELLVTDNCSVDATAEIARGYAGSDPRVRVVVNARNLGQFGNRNRAAELARAPFLKYHDSDDILYPHCLETMLDPLLAEPRAGFALSAGASWPGGPCPMLSTPRQSYEREFLGRGMFYCGPSGALFRTEVLRALGGFEDRGAASDYLFWLRACRSVNVLLVPADLFWYRIHPGQELSSPSAADSYALADAEAWRALDRPDCPLTGEALEQARRNLSWTLAKLSWRDLRAGRVGLAGKRLRAAGIGARDVVRYLRRQRRDSLAGTPLDADGDFIVPDLSRRSGR